jgi:hypothetical protein
MKKGWVIPTIVIVLIVGGLLGLVFLFSRVKSSIQYGFDFGSALDAIVFLAVGGLIEYAFSKRYSDKRADTDLLLGIVGEAKAALVALEKVALNYETGRTLTSKQQVALICASRDLSNTVHSIEIGLRHCKIRLDALEFDKVKYARLELNESLTDSPFPGPYDHSCIARIRTATKAMRDELTRMAFAVNHR